MRKRGGLAEWLGWLLDSYPISPNSQYYFSSEYAHLKDGYAYFYVQTTDKWALIQRAYNNLNRDYYLARLAGLEE